jgi:phage baseplate assembly protein V
MTMQPGVMVGLVKSVTDPAGQGRVQVTFPTLGGVTSGWAPVATELAGKNRGVWFMPELQDEVLVAFDQGDFDHPYIVGFLWNGDDQPPETEVQNRIIKTPGGHQLRFEDKDGAKKVILKTNGGLAVTMDDSNKTIVIACGGQTVSLDDSQQSIQLTGGGRSVTLQSGQVKIT